MSCRSTICQISRNGADSIFNVTGLQYPYGVVFSSSMMLMSSALVQANFRWTSNWIAQLASFSNFVYAEAYVKDDGFEIMLNDLHPNLGHLPNLYLNLKMSSS